jgi:hypothetical protein
MSKARETVDLQSRNGKGDARQTAKYRCGSDYRCIYKAAFTTSAIQSVTVRNFNEFSTTEIDDALIAKAANIGLINKPITG